eukprot:4533070-Alexandrium_andersonii.AAC.1
MARRAPAGGVPANAGGSAAEHDLDAAIAALERDMAAGPSSGAPANVAAIADASIDAALKQTERARLEEAAAEYATLERERRRLELEAEGRRLT